MKAAYVQKYGRHEPLVIGEVPPPVLQENEILINVHAASLNPIDYKIRNGMLRPIRSYNFPLVLGHDCAGVIVDVGMKVTKFKKGDAVFARPQKIGTLAELIAVPENEVAKKPSNISFEEAATLPLVGLTSWQALVGTANLQKGQKVFIPAGSGGVGSFAIQLAKHLGAEVWSTTSAKNADFVKSFGADHVLDYRTPDFESSIKNMNVVFDTLGGESLNKSFSMLKPGGWLISIAGLPDLKTAKDLNLGLFKSALLGIVGILPNLKAKTHKCHYRFLFMKPNGEQLSQIAKLVEAQVVKPVIDKVFSFQDCQSAIEYLETGRARGKVVVKIS
jgi:alcohol dehydrogenase